MCLSIAVDDPSCVLSRGEYLGYRWIIMHNFMGYRCGYVHVPSGHPWQSKTEDDTEVNVHGGLIFIKPDVVCGDKSPADGGWWLGFGCFHAGDGRDYALPMSRTLYDLKNIEIPGEQIRTTEYVRGQCHKLIDQAVAASQVKP